MACKLAKTVSFSKCDHFLLSRAQKYTAPCALCYLLHTVRLVRSRSKTKQVAGRSSFSWVGFYVMSTIPEVKWKIKMPTIRKMSRNSSQTFFWADEINFNLKKVVFLINVRKSCCFCIPTKWVKWKKQTEKLVSNYDFISNLCWSRVSLRCSKKVMSLTRGSEGTLVFETKTLLSCQT